MAVLHGLLRVERVKPDLLVKVEMVRLIHAITIPLVAEAGVAYTEAGAVEPTALALNPMAEVAGAEVQA
jgi:hypothetical protein